MAQEAYRSEVEALWAYCFEKESDPWFRWYFSEAYRPPEVLLGLSSGHVAAQLHRRPYEIYVRRRPVPVDYIIGVSTHPAARGRGYAKALLQEAFRKAKKEHKGMVILMPSSADFYRPLGFSLYAWQWQREASPKVLRPLGARPSSVRMVSDVSDIFVLDGLYQSFTRRKRGYALRDAGRWKEWLSALLAEGSSVAVFYDGSSPVSYVAYGIEDGVLTASEMVYVSEAGRRFIYFFMAGHEGSVSKCRWWEPSSDRSFMDFPNGAEHTFIENRSFPFMMGRVVSPEAAFSGIPCAEDFSDHFSFSITDEIMPENEGLYEFFGDKGELRLVRRSDKGKSAFRISVRSLTELLFGTRSFSDLWQSGDISCSSSVAKGVIAGIWERFFPKENNWVNEWF